MFIAARLHRGLRNEPITPLHRNVSAPRQIVAALLMLAAGWTGQAIARELGLEEHTITRWRRLPAFLRELDRQQNLAMMYQLSDSRVRSSNGSQPEQRYV